MAKSSDFSLGAPRRLKREQQIETLFREGKAFSVFPLRFVWKLAARQQEPEPLRVGFSVSKKKFKRAVDRGRVKRLMRENFRQQQSLLHAHIAEEAQLHLFLIYTAPSLPGYHSMQEALSQGLERLKKILEDA